MAKKKKNGKSNGHSNGNGKSEFSKRNKSLLGYNSIFTPEVIDDIHIKAQLGRYRMRGMALMKKIPTFDDLVFLPGTLTRFVIEGYREKCETKTIIGPRCENPIEQMLAATDGTPDIFPLAIGECLECLLLAVALGVFKV